MEVTRGSQMEVLQGWGRGRENRSLHLPRSPGTHFNLCSLEHCHNQLSSQLETVVPCHSGTRRTRMSSALGSIQAPVHLLHWFRLDNLSMQEQTGWPLCCLCYRDTGCCRWLRSSMVPQLNPARIVSQSLCIHNKWAQTKRNTASQIEPMHSRCKPELSRGSWLPKTSQAQQLWQEGCESHTAADPLPGETKLWNHRPVSSNPRKDLEDHPTLTLRHANELELFWECLAGSAMKQVNTSSERCFSTLTVKNDSFCLLQPWWASQH